MSNSTIKLKSSTTSGNTPSSLETGEFAINVADGNLFYGSASAVKQDLVLETLTVKGSLTAENYIVSSSVTYMTQSFSSGSTIFGDTQDDTHQFTGSLFITGGLDVDRGDVTLRNNLEVGKLDRKLTLTGGTSVLSTRPTITGDNNSFVNFDTGLNLVNEKKISFDSDQTNTYIAANSETPEDLEIHADQDIILNPDGQVIANSDISSSGNVYATEFHGDGSNLTNLPQNVVNDTTPQLGGNLDVNGNEIQSTGDVIVRVDSDNNTALSKFVIKDGAGTSIYTIDEEGTTIATTGASNNIKIGNLDSSLGTFNGISLNNNLTYPGIIGFAGGSSTSDNFFLFGEVVDIRAGGASDASMRIAETGGETTVVINHAFPVPTSHTLYVDGNGKFNDDLDVTGDISASGTIVGSNLSGTNTGDQDLSSYSTIVQLNASSSALQTNIDAKASITQLNASSSALQTNIDAKVSNASTASFAITGSNVTFANITASGNISASGDITASNLFITDTAIYNTVEFTNSNIMKFNQRYTGGANGTYFTNGEYQKVVTITPSAASQNYQVVGRMTAQNAGETHTVYFNAALRSNTLPALSFTTNYEEEYNGGRYLDPQLWAKETTTAGFIIAFKTLATIYGSVTIDFDVIPRGASQKANVTINQVVDSEQTSVDAGFTAYDMQRNLRNQNGNFTISGSLAIEGFADVSASLAAAVAGGDDLGNHTATTDLNMGGNDITNVGNVDGVDVSTLNSSFNTLEGKTLVSGSAQIASDISGSFTAASASFSTRVTANDAKLTANTSNVTSAGALMDSEVTSLSLIKGLTAAQISGAFDATSASLASDIPTNNNQLTNGAGYTTNTGTVTSVGGTGTVSGLSLSGTVTTSGNLTLGGTISISSTNITDVDAFSQSGTYASLRAQGTTAADVGLGNVTNESKTTMFTSPTFTGTTAAPTPSTSDDSTKIATTAYVQANLDDLIGNAGAALDTLGELSASLADATGSIESLVTEIDGKLAKSSNLSDLTNAATARTNLGVDAAGTDNSTDVTLTGTPDYITISGQTITRNQIDLTSDVTGQLPAANLGTITSAKISDVDAFSQTGTYASLRAQGTTAGDVGLGNVTNESKATMFSSPTFTGTVSGVTKTHVGLGNVENTALSTYTGNGGALDNQYITNGAGYTTNTGTVTSVGGTGTVSGLSLSGTVTTSGNLTLGGTISISSTNITDVDAFSQSGTYASLRAQGTTAGDVGLGNVTNESKATMFTSPTFTGTVAIPGFADVSASLAAAVAGGDNLGNHTATTDLNLDGNNITNVSNITTATNSNLTIDPGGTGNILLKSTDIGIQHSGLGAGSLNFYELGNAQYTRLQGQTVASNITVSLPTSTGTLALTSDIDSVSASLAADIPTNNNQLTNGAGYLTTVDISTDTNLVGGTNLTLSGDTMNLDASISLTNISASGEIYSEGGIHIDKTGATANEKLFTITEDGNERFYVDEDGDAGMDGTLSVTGNVTSNSNVTGTRFLATGGNQSAPSFAFNSDGNSGIYQPAADNLSLQVGGGTAELTLNTSRVYTNVDLDIGASSAISLETNGNITASGIIVPQYESKVSSFFSSDGNADLIPFGGTLNENTLAQYYSTVLAPYGGKIIRAYVLTTSSGTGAFTLTVRKYTGLSTATDIASGSATISTSYTPTLVEFSDHTFDPGDSIGIWFDPTGTPSGVNITTLWRMDSI